MESIIKNIYKEIVSVAVSEDGILKKICGKGIFFMPELALIFQVGKSIFTNYDKIFQEKGWEWEREYKVEPEGPSDLILNNLNSKRKIIIEFKIKNTYHSYIKDVEKLSRINGDNNTKLFCALMDVFSNDMFNDKRFIEFEKRTENLVERIPKEFDFFTTLYSNYKHHVACLVGMWKVK